jgi:hypothetical protein
MAAGDVGLVGVRGATARLVRPACDELDLRLHFVRYAHSGERYLGPLPLTDPPPLAVLEVDLTTPFEDLRGLEQVYGRVRRANIDDRAIDWPHHDASGHSPAAAEALLQRFPAGHQEMQT